MKINFNVWRFVVTIAFAKSMLWGKGDDTYFIHVGTFTDGKNSALKVVILPLSIMIGFAGRK